MINIDDVPNELRWHGVFQGGGAKGAAYAGALRAIQQEGHWFDAVAGASAGALTAALVAAGHDCDDLGTLTNRLLAQISPANWVDRLIARVGPGVLTGYRSDHLEAELELILQTAVVDLQEKRNVSEPRRRVSDDRPVTFAELFRTSKVRLYVVASDTTYGQPIPFCAETTPDLSVSAAVMASCALPVAFSPRFLRVPESVLQLSDAIMLQDGGLWANYPDFVFTNAGFRRAFGLQSYETPPPILGFTLSMPALRTEPVAFVDPAPRKSGLQGQYDDPERWLYLLTKNRSRSTSSKPPPNLWRRLTGWTLAIAALVLSVWLLVATISAAYDDAAQWRLVPALSVIILLLVGVGASRFLPVDLMLLCLLIGLGALAAGAAISTLARGNATLTVIGASAASLIVSMVIWYTALLLHAKARSLTVAGINAANSVLGQAVLPPVWVDSLPNSHLLFIPYGALDTTTFSPPSGALSDAVEAAYRASQQQFAEILGTSKSTFASRMTEYETLLRAVLRERGMPVQLSSAHHVVDHVTPRQ